MDLINTLEHRISVNAGDGEKVHRPGPFEAEGKELSAFKKVPGVVEADSDEGRAWLTAHPEDPSLSGEGEQIARRARAAAFGADARADMAVQNRTVIGDDAAPAGPASGVVSAAGDRPVDPALTTTETEADALRHGIDLSGEPPLGPVGPSGETLADQAPGSPQDAGHAAAADAEAGVPLAETPIPSRTGVPQEGDGENAAAQYIEPGSIPEGVTADELAEELSADELGALAEARDVSKSGTKAEVAERVIEADHPQA